MIKIMLTSAGFENPNIENKFKELLLPQKSKTIKAMWIPTAATNADSKAVLPKCWNDLARAGINEKDIICFDCEYPISYEELSKFDVVYVCGGSPEYLLKKVHEIELEKPLWEFILHGGIYVGVSAGSWIAVDNIDNNLGYAHCTIDVHQPTGSPPGFIDITKHPHIKLTNAQAILRIDDTYSVIE